VIDIGDWQGYGICFSHASLDDILEAMERALHIFKDKPLMHEVRERMMSVNNSWETSANKYIELYQSIYK
jgi:starch synthase